MSRSEEVTKWWKDERFNLLELHSENLPFIRSILENNPHYINQQGAGGFTLLHEAVMIGSHCEKALDIVKLLVDEFKFDVNTCCFGKTSALLAFEMKRLDIFEFLVNKDGINLDLPYENGRVLYDILCECASGDFTFGRDASEYLKLLQYEPPSVSKDLPRKQKLLLHYIKEGSQENAIRLIDENAYLNLNAIDDEGHSLLTLSVREGRDEVVRRLLSGYADINYLTPSGDNALSLVIKSSGGRCEGRYTSIVRQLLFDVGDSAVKIDKDHKVDGRSMFDLLIYQDSIFAVELIAAGFEFDVHPESRVGLLGRSISMDNKEALKRILRRYTELYVEVVDCESESLPSGSSQLSSSSQLSPERDDQLTR